MDTILNIAITQMREKVPLIPFLFQKNIFGDQNRLNAMVRFQKNLCTTSEPPAITSTKHLGFGATSLRLPQFTKRQPK